MRLGDAHGQVAEAVLLVAGQLRVCRRGVGDVGSAVDLGGDLLDLRLQGVRVVVAELKVARLVAGLDHGVGQVDRAFATVAEVGAHRHAGADALRYLADRLVLAGEVAREGVDGDDRGDAMDLHVLDLLDQVGRTGAHIVGVLGQQVGGQWLSGHDLELAAVRLQRAHGGDQDRCVGHHARGTALDVEEALRAHVGAEAGLGDQVVAAALADQVADDAAVAMGDVAERAGVHDDWRVLERLQQVGLQCLLHDDRHRAGTVELLGGDRLTGLGVADDDATHAGTHVGQRSGKGEDGHHFGGGGDVEAGLACDSVHLAAEADDDVAQAAVVHVEHAAPRDVVDVEAQFVALVQVVVDHGGQQVVGSGDGMEVAGEVQVQQLHRDDLAVATACRATLDAERGTHAGLAQADDGLLADVLHGLAEADRGGGLALAERGGCDGRDHDVLRLWAVAELVDRLELDLGEGVAVLLEQMRADAHLGGDVGERGQLGGAGDLEIGREGHGNPFALRSILAELYTISSI